MADVKRQVEKRKAIAAKAHEKCASKAKVQTRQRSQNWDDDDDESDSGSEFPPLRPTNYQEMSALDIVSEAGPSHRNALSVPVEEVEKENGLKPSNGVGTKTSEGEKVDASGREEEPNIGISSSVPILNTKKNAERTK